MGISIALAGNPNSGKTTMFNALTGSAQYVGNRPGVTVEHTTGRLKTHKDVDLVDLPGIYSLSPYTAEEVVSRDYLLDEHPDAIINLVDASNIERNLYLTTQLCEVGFPVIIALNMIDVIQKNGDRIDIPKLSKLLGCEIVETSALKETGLEILCEKAVQLAKTKKHFHGICRFSPMIEDTLRKIQELILPFCEEVHMRWYTIKVFERDERVLSSLKLSPEIRNTIDHLIARCERYYDDESDSIIINERYIWITNIISKCVVRHKAGTTPAEKVDNIMTNRIFALPLFILIMCGVYYISIQLVGNITTEWMETLVAWFGSGVNAFLSSVGTAEWLNALIVDGIISGVGAVLTFIPQLMILFLFLALLEDCGYMARIAFIMDRIFRKFGLSGKSFIPLLVASGCGVPGIMSCRTIESETDRKITVMVTTFVPCGAKLPIIALISGGIFGNSALIAISVYFIGILMVFMSGVILKKTRSFASEPAPFVMEMPAYHLPSAKNVALHVWDDVRAFVVKAGTVIFVGSGIIWLLSNFSFAFQLVDSSESMLAYIGRAIAPVFAPLGFGHWEATVATLTGIVAKENIVSSLNILYTFDSPAFLQNIFTAPSAYAFLIFNMLCSPCVAAIAAISKEMGSTKDTLFAIAYQTIVAYAVALIIYQFGSLLGGASFGAGSIAAALVLLLSLWLLFRPVHNKSK